MINRSTIMAFFAKCRMMYQNAKLSSKVIFILTGLFSTIWFLIRVIPKPQRATYPCMRAAAPIMSGFVIYILGLGGMTLLFKKSISLFKRARYWSAVFACFTALVVLAAFNIKNVTTSLANTLATPKTVLPDSPNSPVGDAIGINPGRVVWSYNPAATNENCKNIIVLTGSWPNTVMDWVNSDAYIMPKNNNQDTINKMADQSVMAIAGETSISAAWDAIFKNFNERKTGSATGYTAGQKIFIKVNNGQAGWAINSSDLSEKGNNSSTGVESAAMSNTSPFPVVAIIRQLVNYCGVNQADIYVGEPMTHVYKSMYDAVHNAFPNVKILDKENKTSLGRTTTAGWVSNSISYSDKGKVMTQAIKDNIMQEMYNADYMINVAALKAHARSGVSTCAKNHFGSSTHGDTYSASRLHSGSVNPNSDNDDLTNARGDYHMYRVLTDMIGHNKLGGNTVLFVVDGLWAGIEATDMPVKWQMAPFNNDFPSSLFISQDEVALESVCLDFLRAEADINANFNNRPFFPAVDDYLHQAASKANWPDSIKSLSNSWFVFAGYDPEGDGSFMPSMGAHEHWNNPTNKQYSRNLYSNGTGIELLSFPQNLVTYSNGTAYSLTFTITNNDSPVESVVVVVNGSNYLTGSDGKVVVNNMAAVNDLAYSISKDGYTTITGQVDISGDTQVEKDFGGSNPVDGISEVNVTSLQFSVYPNPMSTECNISYSLHSNASVSLIITGIDGKIVKQIEIGFVSKGDYTQKFYSENLSPGIYLCILKAQYSNKTEVKTLKLEIK